MAKLQLRGISSSLLELRQFVGLRKLTLDLAMLLTLVPAPQATGYVYSAAYTYVVPQMSSQKLIADIDFTLPRTLASLTLRVSNEQACHLMFISTLDALCRDVRKHFPNLTRQEVA